MFEKSYTSQVRLENSIVLKYFYENVQEKITKKNRKK